MLNTTHSAQSAHSIHSVYSAQLQHVQQWIKRLEGKAIELLDGLAIDEMTPKHQADVALKCLDHVQRFSAIEKRLQDGSQANNQHDLLTHFMRAARGEYDPTDNESIDHPHNGNDVHEAHITTSLEHSQSTLPPSIATNQIPLTSRDKSGGMQSGPSRKWGVYRRNEDGQSNNTLPPSIAPDPPPVAASFTTPDLSLGAGQSRNTEASCLSSSNRDDPEHTPDKPPNEPATHDKDSSDDVLPEELLTRQEEVNMTNDFVERMREREEQRKKDEEEELWAWLGDLIDQARAEGKDFFQWLDEQEERRQWHALPENDLSQADDDDFRQRFDELEYERQEPLWSHEEMTYEEEQELAQLLNQQEWLEHTYSDEEADQEEESWYRNGWWLNEEDFPGDEDEELPWDEL